MAPSKERIADVGQTLPKEASTLVPWVFEKMIPIITADTMYLITMNSFPVI